MPKRSVEQDYAVAIHESAHTFAFLHFDLSVEEVTINPDGRTKTVRLSPAETRTIGALSELLGNVPKELWVPPFESVLATLKQMAPVSSYRPDQVPQADFIDKLGETYNEFCDTSREGIGEAALSYLKRLEHLLSRFVDIVLARAGHVHGETKYRSSPTKSLSAGQKVKAENIAVVYAAGHEAARHLPGEPSFGGFSDDVAMRTILDDVSQFPFHKAEKAANEMLVRARASALVAHYRVGIELLANHLISVRRMSGSEVRDFLFDHDISIATFPRPLS